MGHYFEVYPFCLVFVFKSSSTAMSYATRFWLADPQLKSRVGHEFLLCRTRCSLGLVFIVYKREVVLVDEVARNASASFSPSMQEFANTFSCRLLLGREGEWY